MNQWYNRYLKIPWKRDGFNNTGLDCFNLIRWVYLQEKNIDVRFDSNYYTSNYPNDGLYNFLETNPFDVLDQFEQWIKATGVIRPFDVITLNRPKTDSTNHCGIYTGDGFLLHTNQKDGVLLSRFVSGHGWYNRMRGVYRWKTLS